MRPVMVASASPQAVEVVRACLGSKHRVETTESRKACLEAFARRRFEYTFIDLELLAEGQEDYETGLQRFWKISPSAEIIVLTQPGRIREAVSAVKAGAGNYLTHPLDPAEVGYVLHSLHESLRVQAELEYLRDSFWRQDAMEVITSHSPAMQLALEQVRLVAPTTTAVLLTGETGTGKGVIARLLHRHSMRGENQFLAAHCGAIPDTLIESELFGHEKGAFTGAHARKLGRFETAKGGTLFLDEIGTVSPAAQIRLLEVLQDKTFTRVGGETPLTADVRVIAATNIDLRKMVQAGTFRSDLYYRLNVFPIHIPPLRERVEDIALLVKSFLKRLNRQHLKEIHGLQPEVLEALKRYSWPGNIRELENLIERAYILEKGSTLGPEVFPAELFAFDPTAAAEPKGAPPTLAEVRRRGLDQIERRYLREVLTATAGRVDRAAAMAGLTPRQVHNLMTKHGLRKEEFRQPRTEGRSRFSLPAT